MKHHHYHHPDTVLVLEDETQEMQTLCDIFPLFDDLAKTYWIYIIFYHFSAMNVDAGKPPLRSTKHHVSPHLDGHSVQNTKQSVHTANRKLKCHFICDNGKKIRKEINKYEGLVRKIGLAWLGTYFWDIFWDICWDICIWD